MQNKLNEIGRSLMEMLSVLAVIGILSVAGIMGYKFAMDKYQANQTVNDINLRALDILIQQSEKKPISLDEWHDIATIFPMELVFDADTKETKALIQVSNVPQGVCQILVNDMYAHSEIAINGYIIEDGSNADCTDNNTLDFYFGTNEPCGSTYCVAKAPYCHKKVKHVRLVLHLNNVRVKNRDVIIFNVKPVQMFVLKISHKIMMIVLVIVIQVCTKKHRPEMVLVFVKRKMF